MKTASILLFLGAFLAAALAQTQAPAGNAENGKRLFMRDGCFQCHGTVGQGSKDGARIGPPVLNQQALVRYVRRPTGAMPAFTAKVVTDAELGDIYAYLRSVPAPQAIKDIPLLDQLK